MNVLVILCHPQKGSFNHAIAETVIETLNNKGHNVKFHDLYEENFNPILQYEEILENKSEDPLIENHCIELGESDGIIIIHPNWWEQAPALLKGWIDRVLRTGLAYKYSKEGKSIGLLKANGVIVFNTSNTPEDIELDVYGDPLEFYWKNCVFKLCGINTFFRRMYTGVIKSSLKQRELWLKETEEIVNKYF